MNFRLPPAPPSEWRERRAGHHRWPLGAGFHQPDRAGRGRHRLDGGGHDAGDAPDGGARPRLPALCVVHEAGACAGEPPQATAPERQCRQCQSQSGGRKPHRDAGFRRHAGGHAGGCRHFLPGRQCRGHRHGQEFQSPPAQGRPELRPHLFGRHHRRDRRGAGAGQAQDHGRDGQSQAGGGAGGSRRGRRFRRAAPRIPSPSRGCCRCISRPPSTQDITVTRTTEGGYTADVEKKELQVHRHRAGGTIDSSLYLAGHAGRHPRRCRGRT